MVVGPGYPVYMFSEFGDNKLIIVYISCNYFDKADIHFQYPDEP